MAAPIRIVIADDHSLFRQGLKSLLRHETGVAIVGETDRADEISSLLLRAPCDLLLLDLQMEHNLLADIEALARRIPVIVLTASEVPSDAVTALRHGARAVVFKRFAIETLMEAIHTVAGGQVWLAPSLQTHLAAQLRAPTKGELSAREEEIVRCVALGLRNAEVAQRLSIAEETVKTHLHRIFRKLGVRDRVELVLLAARAGIVRR